MLCICGGYQFLGTYYKMSDGTVIKCLNILPLHTVFKADARMIGDTNSLRNLGRPRPSRITPAGRTLMTRTS
jgi:CobQ-like glutamine amidotransferase family enzyme